MRKNLVTGVAGFVGSSIAEYLLRHGEEVIGIDNFHPYYDRNLKEHNIASILSHPSFTFFPEDLNDIDLPRVLEGITVIYHQSAQAGVLASWGNFFQSYIDSNIRATQRLLEYVREHPVERFVYASSSSVYGNITDLPVQENSQTVPISPYGVTKLAAEHLCKLYAYNFGIPTVSLRYFTVYGPRQRPDMGIHKFIRAVLTGKEITIYGDGRQSRDFTYISDIVSANIAAATCPVAPGSVFNIGGGSCISVNELVDVIQTLAKKRTHIRYVEKQAGPHMI
jgi:nucleoside-diphosphate-sugar epimerase